jgi:putative PIN family toxin of toxin-antitoxin system
MIIVPDTNIIVSGFITRTSYPAQVMDLWRSGNIEIATSKEILDEYTDVLSREGVKKYTRQSDNEIIQLYTHTTCASVTHPLKELKGFKRVSLQPNETRTVMFGINVDQFAYYNIDMRYALTPGKIEIMVGRSAVDLPLQGEFMIDGEEVVIRDKAFFSSTSEI